MHLANVCVCQTFQLVQVSQQGNLIIPSQILQHFSFKVTLLLLLVLLSRYSTAIKGALPLTLLPLFGHNSAFCYFHGLTASLHKQAGVDR